MLQGAIDTNRVNSGRRNECSTAKVICSGSFAFEIMQLEIFVFEIFLFNWLIHERKVQRIGTLIVSMPNMRNKRCLKPLK